MRRKMLNLRTRLQVILFLSLTAICEVVNAQISAHVDAYMDLQPWEGGPDVISRSPPGAVSYSNSISLTDTPPNPPFSFNNTPSTGISTISAQTTPASDGNSLAFTGDESLLVTGLAMYCNSYFEFSVSCPQVMRYLVSFSGTTGQVGPFGAGFGGSMFSGLGTYTGTIVGGSTGGSLGMGVDGHLSVNEQPFWHMSAHASFQEMNPVTIPIGGPQPISGNAIWAQPQSGNWSTQTNWLQNVLPASGIDTFFNTGSSTPYTVSLTGASAAKSVTLQGDNVTLAMGGNNLAVGGVISVDGFGGQGSLALSGPGTVSAAGGVTVTSSGTLSGNSTIIGNVSNAGVVAPGSTNPGTLTINGNYSQSGALNVRVNGATVTNDKLSVSGTASLAGNLGVALLGNTIPANADSYQVLSAGSLNGTFSNSNNQLVEAKFTNGSNAANNNSAGLFSVSYANNAVTLSNFHQVHVLSIGVTDSGVPNVGSSIFGISAATAVGAALAKLPGVVSDNVLPLTAPYGQNNSGNVTALETAISNVSVQPGDTFIFYINAHAASSPWPTAPQGSEAPIIPQVENPDGTVSISSTSTTGPTTLSLSGTTNYQGETLDAATLKGLFSGPNASKWNSVNKLFVMDTCNAYGFWQGVSDSTHPTIQYLAALPHSAIIAAAPEGVLAEGHPNFPEDNYSGGDLGHALISAIDEINQLGGNFSFSELENLTVSNELATDTILGNTAGFVEDWPNSAYGVPLSGILPDSVTGNASSDFQLGLLPAVPEPASIGVLIGVVGIALSRRRWRRETRKNECGPNILCSGLRF
jgi:hypothetical protein